MGSYKKIGLSHEMGLIDTPPLTKHHRKIEQNEKVCRAQGTFGGICTYCNISCFILNIAEHEFFPAHKC